MLQRTLDLETYQIIRKYQEDAKDTDDSKLRTHLIYEYIQKSNSPLKRRQKLQLEGSIERVMAMLHEEKEKEKEKEDEENMAPKNANATEGTVSPNRINRMIVNSWGLKPQFKPEYQPKRLSSQNLNDELKRKKKRKETKEEDSALQLPPHPSYSMEQIGGMDDVLERFFDLVVLPLKKARSVIHFGGKTSKGIVLHGPPGCGKTMLAHAVAAETKVPLISLLGPSIVSGMSGESEQKIREHFAEAKRLAPSILFIDEIDALAPKREGSQSHMERRIVAQILLSMDDLVADTHNLNPVIVLAATNRPDSLDAALRRGGRFDTEINIPVPNEIMRQSILQSLLKSRNYSEDIDFPKLGKMTAGFVGSDLDDLIGKAASWNLLMYAEALMSQEMKTDYEMEMEVDMDMEECKSTVKNLSIKEKWKLLVKRAECGNKPEPPGFEDLKLNMDAFLAVLPHMQPSSKREGFATVPDTTWEQVGALDEARSQLEADIVKPIQNPEIYQNLGLSLPSGVLLWGPPGCGKTLLAKAVANESKANFISIKGPELINKYLGESERAVRQVFARARSSVPCILFFDEFDALVPRRDDQSSEASSRIVNTLLSELDGVGESRKGIFIVAATNRPDIIDSALLRPGRLDKSIYIGIPDDVGRIQILRSLMRGVKVDPALAVLAKSNQFQGFSGADLENLLRGAGQQTIERNGDQLELIDFQKAIPLTQRSVGDDEIRKYERLRRDRKL